MRDEHVDRAQVQAWRHVQPSATNGPKASRIRHEGRSARHARADVVRRRASLGSLKGPSSFRPRQGRSPGDTHGGYSAEVHLFPFRTEKLSPAAPMILRGTAGKQVAATPYGGARPQRTGPARFLCISTQPPNSHPLIIFYSLQSESPLPSLQSNSFDFYSRTSEFFPYLCSHEIY